MGVYLPLSLNDNIEQWRDHSVLCYCWLGGGISAFECQWQHWTVKRSLCPLIVLQGGYICLSVSMTTLNSEKYHSVPLSVLSLNDNSRHVKNDNIVLTTVNKLNSKEITLSCIVSDLNLTSAKGGISAFECQWQHWTVKRSLCPLIVLNGGRGYICSLSLNDNIKQWRDHSVLW